MNFGVVLSMIRGAQQRAYHAVNSELINLYWSVGEYISTKVHDEDWGKGVVVQLAAYIQSKEPNVKGFSDKNLWRMKQFYETYRNNPKLSTLSRELSWSRSMSPTLVSQYELALPNKEILQAKLRELTNGSVMDTENINR